MTAKEYGAHLEENLRDLHERLRDNRYIAPPGERVWIDKEGRKEETDSQACFEDKIVQRAVVMILEAIFEHDFFNPFPMGSGKATVNIKLFRNCVRGAGS